MTCTVGTLAPGAVARVNVIVQMQNQTITNSATVSGTDTAGTAVCDQQRQRDNRRASASAFKHRSYH